MCETGCFTEGVILCIHNYSGYTALLKINHDSVELVWKSLTDWFELTTPVKVNFSTSSSWNSISTLDNVLSLYTSDIGECKSIIVVLPPLDLIGTLRSFTV